MECGSPIGHFSPGVATRSSGNPSPEDRLQPASTPAELRAFAGGDPGPRRAHERLQRRLVAQCVTMRAPLQACSGCSGGFAVRTGNGFRKARWGQSKVQVRRSEWWTILGSEWSVCCWGWQPGTGSVDRSGWLFSLLRACWTDVAAAVELLSCPGGQHRRSAVGQRPDQRHLAWPPRRSGAADQGSSRFSREPLGSVLKCRGARHSEVICRAARYRGTAPDPAEKPGPSRTRSV